MLYLTVGTGIGVGAIVDEKVVVGWSHPEMGHMRIPQHQDDCEPGSPGGLWGGSVVHGNCWEGLASGPARAKRAELWAEAGLSGPDATLLESEYIALGLVNLISSYRPERLVIGGGVLHDPALLPSVRMRTVALLDVGYFPEALQIDDLVAAPAARRRSGRHGRFVVGGATAARPPAKPFGRAAGEPDRRRTVRALAAFAALPSWFGWRGDSVALRSTWRVGASPFRPRELGPGLEVMRRERRVWWRLR